MVGFLHLYDLCLSIFVCVWPFCISVCLNIPVTYTYSFQSLESSLEKAGTVYSERVGALASSWTEASKLPDAAVATDGSVPLQLIEHLHRSVGLTLLGLWGQIAVPLLVDRSSLWASTKMRNAMYIA